MKTNKLLIGMLVLVTLAFTLPNQVDAQNMTLAPHKIILNAQASSLDLDCHWGGILQSGTSIVGQSIQIYVNGNLLPGIEAYDLTYCWIDNIFKASFNRLELMANSYVQSLANVGPVEVVISGNYTVEDGNGVQYTHLIADRWDWLEIESPSKKKK